MSSDDLHDLVGAYAVGALDELEAAAFARHLESCPACRDELASYGPALEALAEPAPGEPAPDLSALSARIAAEVAHTPQSASPSGATGRRDATLGHHVAPRRRLPRLLATAAALVVVAAVGLGLGVGGALLGDDGSSLASDVDRIRLASDAVTLPLELGDATVYVSESVGGIAVVGDTPALDSGTVYQVWIVPADGGDAIPGPVMDVSPEGSVTGAWLTELDDAAAVALSIEPEGGSTVPTKVVAAVEITA